MMKKRIRQWAALCAAVGIAGSAVMGCGSSAPKPDAGSGQTSREAADGTGTGSGGGAHIGIIFTEAGLGGNSFNDLALEGVKKAAADYGITTMRWSQSLCQMRKSSRMRWLRPGTMI